MSDRPGPCGHQGVGSVIRRMLALAAWALAGCAIQLAPAYDESLVTGLNEVNQQIMELYASTSMGVAASTFPSRVDRYNRVIGKLDALALQSANRPVPDTKVQDRVQQAVKTLPEAGGTMRAERMQAALNEAAEACAKVRNVRSFQVDLPEPPAQGYVPASAHALTQISRGITLLRDTDCANGLTAGSVALNRGFVTHYMDQALTYETYLKD